MTRTRPTLTAIVIALTIAACGRTNGVQTKPAAPTTPTTTVDQTEPTTTSTTAATQDTRAAVKAIHDRFTKKYDAVIKEAEDALGTTNEGDPIDNAIQDACQAAPNNGKLTSEEVGIITMFVGEILTRHGKDVATFAADIADHNQAIIKLGVCTQ